jgi:hypothetical protein
MEGTVRTLEEDLAIVVQAIRWAIARYREDVSWGMEPAWTSELEDDAPGVT